MNVEVIAIGNELLSGSTVNTNAAFISEQLQHQGYIVSRHTVLSDEVSQMRLGFQEALRRSRLVISTGGLGPTCDDLTRNVAAELFGSDFRYDEEIANDIKRRFGQDAPTIKNQATVPTKAIILRNSIGTAPGMIFQGDGSTLILLPGVPLEMRAMMLDQVMSYLKTHQEAFPKRYTKRLQFFGLPESAVDPMLREIKEKHANIECGIYPDQGILTVTVSAQASSEEQAEEILKIPYNFICSKFSSSVFYSATGKLEHAVHEMLLQKGLTLSAAESCTGGVLSAKLTQIPGASKYFIGSVVAYSNELKFSLLGVSQDTLSKYGAVSEEVVAEMCLGILKLTGSDYAVAISGIAGPSGGSPEKPIGTLWCAFGKQGEKPLTWLCQGKGNREMIIKQGANALLAKIYSMLK